MTDKPIIAADADEDMLIPAKDPETGRFLTGNKIGGRIKGSRNKINRLRLEIEEAGRLLLRERSESLLTKAMDMAMGGDSIIMKALIDKFLTTPKDDEDANKRPDAVKVIVVTTPSSSPPTVTVSRVRDPVTIDHSETPENG